MLGTIAFISEYLISKEKGEALVLKLIDISQFLSSKNVDKLISRVSLYLSERYDKIYGKRYFGRKEWIISSFIAFTYCYVFYMIESQMGFKSSIFKQLGYWFIPNLVADVLSINFTRWLLSKIYRDPSKYIKYLFYDVLFFALSFYICFSFTILFLSIYSEYSVMRIILHPIYMFISGVENFPQPIAIDALLVICMASTTFIPTFIHFVFVIFAVLAKFTIPIIRYFVFNLIERMISFDRHPVGVAVIASGVFFLPFILVIRFAI